MPTLDRSAVLLGRRVHELRLSRGLTLVQLASQARLSHSFLSQLERGLARPSMTSLERIARALGSSQVELLAGLIHDRTTGAVAVGPDSSPDSSPHSSRHSSPAACPDVVRADEGSWGCFADGRARVLVVGARRLTPVEFIGSNPEFGDFFAHDEDEFLTVVEGALVVDLGTGVVHELGVGDSLYCVGGTPHRWRSASTTPYRLFLVKENPNRP